MTIIKIFYVLILQTVNLPNIYILSNETSGSKLIQSFVILHPDMDGMFVRHIDGNGNSMLQKK